jgi:hypothetical protein
MVRLTAALDVYTAWKCIPGGYVWFSCNEILETPLYRTRSKNPSV